VKVTFCERKAFWLGIEAEFGLFVEHFLGFKAVGIFEF